MTPVQPISLEMHIILAVVSGVLMMAMAGLGYFMKCQFERILDRLDEIDKLRRECRDQLPDRFAGRIETRDNIRVLWKRSDDLNTRMTVVEDRRSAR